MTPLSWPQTEFTKRLSVAIPLIQAPMAGGATSPELVAAVSNTGAVGSLAAGMMPPDELKMAIRKIRELTLRPFQCEFANLPPLPGAHLHRLRREIKRIRTKNRICTFHGSGTLAFLRKTSRNPIGRENSHRQFRIWNPSSFYLKRIP